MKTVRFKGKSGVVSYGTLEGDRVTPAEGDPLQGLTPGRTSLALDEVRLLARIAPPNVLCIGQTYKAHGGGRRQTASGTDPLHEIHHTRDRTG